MTLKGSRSKKCTLPHENLTPAQIRAKNGPVITYDMGKPVTWKIFKFWPEDIQKQYILTLMSNFRVNAIKMSEMMGIGPQELRIRCRALGINLGNGNQICFEDAWKRFLDGEYSNQYSAVHEEPGVTLVAVGDPEPVPTVNCRIHITEVSAVATFQTEEEFIKALTEIAGRVHNVNLIGQKVTAKINISFI